MAGQMQTLHTWEDMETFMAALRGAGFKATPQRIAVHEAMMKLGHATADDIYKRLTDKESTKITVASVYNFLAQMASAGIYGVRMTPSSKMWYDVNPTPHIHLYDKQHDTLMDVEDDEILEELQLHFRRKRFRGHKVTSIDLTVTCTPSKRK